MDSVLRRLSILPPIPTTPAAADTYKGNTSIAKTNDTFQRRPSASDCMSMAVRRVSTTKSSISVNPSIFEIYMVKMNAPGRDPYNPPFEFERGIFRTYEEAVAFAEKDFEKQKKSCECVIKVVGYNFGDIQSKTTISRFEHIEPNAN